MTGRDLDRARLADRLARDLPDAERADARASLAPFDEVTDLLERAGERERALELAGATRPAPGEDRAALELERALAGPVPGIAAPRSRARAILVAVLAAAAVVVAFVALGRRLGPGDEGVPGGLYVGSATCRALEPVGDVARYAPFRWEARVPAGGYAMVAVWAADDPAESTPRLVSGELNELAWSPAAEELAELPDAIRWQVRVYEWSRTLIDEASASARRSSR